MLQYHCAQTILEPSHSGRGPLLPHHYPHTCHFSGALLSPLVSGVSYLFQAVLPSWGLPGRDLLGWVNQFCFSRSVVSTISETKWKYCSQRKARIWRRGWSWERNSGPQKQWELSLGLSHGPWKYPLGPFPLFSLSLTTGRCSRYTPPLYRGRNWGLTSKKQESQGTSVGSEPR